VPVLVERSDELPCRGLYYLHHGLQRRIRLTLVHDSSSDLAWKDVRELVVGRIRTTPESDLDDDLLDGSVLSLGLFPGEYLDAATQQPLPQQPTPSTASAASTLSPDAAASVSLPPGRTMFRFEAAWDSSLHNSPLLNRVTPSGEVVYMTISAYLDVRKCENNMEIFTTPKLFLETPKK